MSFVTNIFLWLLPLISIPLIIHLLNRRKIVRVDFSSIQFLKELKLKSIKKINILQWLLLIIRTLIILFIILMVSRPILKGYFPYLETAPSSSLSVIVIDDSFSMNGLHEGLSRYDIITNAYRQIVETLPEESLLRVLSLSKGILYEGVKKNLSNINLLMSGSNGEGKIVDYINAIEREISINILNKELFVITDGQEVLFENFSSNDLDDWEIYFVIANRLNKNARINGVEIINDVIVKDKILEIQVNVENTGIKASNNRRVFLETNGVRVANANNINLDPKERDIIYFKTALPDFGYNSMRLCLDEDDNPNDNCYYKSIYVPTGINVLFIGNSFKDFEYIENVVKSININNQNDIFNYRVMSYSEWGIEDLQNQDVVIVSGYEIINNDFSLFEEHCRSNKTHLIILPDKGDEPHLLYGITSIDNSDSNQFVSLSSNSYEEVVIESLLDVGPNNLASNESFKVFQYAKQPINANTKIALNKEYSFWDRINFEKSKIDVFYSSMHLDWNSLALKGVFVQFIHELLYANHDQSNNNKYANEQFYLDLDNKIIKGNQVIHKYYNDQSFYQSDDNKHFFIDGLNGLGMHTFFNNEKLFSSIAINASDNELRSKFLSNDEIADKFSKEIYFLELGKDINSDISRSRQGYEMWRYLLWAISILVIFEMIISNVGRKI